MRVTYSIGENKPWRLTKDSALALLKALCMSDGSITNLTVDTTCPPTHCMVRVQVDSAKKDRFLAFMCYEAGITEDAGGQTE